MWLLIEILTLISIALVLYHHAIYPLLLRQFASNRVVNPPRYCRRSYQTKLTDQGLPTITIIIPAYNESAVIADKVRNLATIDYPSDKLSAVIADDGSSDDTVSLAEQAHQEPECMQLNLEILAFEQNRGKVAVLNDVVARADSDLIALSDASAMISIDAMLVAAAHFKQPEVGVVSSTYHLLRPGSAGEETYWRYQTTIKRRESALGAPLGVHGAFYLFRRELFEPLPPDTINDDFILPMKIIAQGYQGIYEPEINSVELEQADLELDQRRRRRIAAGNMQQLIRLWNLLLPRYGGVAFTFASGKALRATMPFWMILALVGSLISAQHASWFWLLAAPQLLGYGLALLRQLLLPRSVPQPLEALHYLVSGHLAGLIGGVSYLMGGYRGAWRRAQHS